MNNKISQSKSEDNFSHFPAKQEAKSDKDNITAMKKGSKGRI
jgi:hypothetical protein